tara:strand:- start:111 stop:347 length:237 start_codon:yes stop_codon:yes gene_type:complete
LKNWAYYPVIVQIERLRERMGALDGTPADQIVAGRYANGSKIRANVHNKRILRLINLEKRAAALITEDFERFIAKTGF